jgi:hypothetical protein
MLASWFLFVDVCRNFGLCRAVRLAVGWLVRREFLVFVRELDRDAPLPVPDDSIRWVDYSDENIALLLQLNPALARREIARRRREGQACELAFSGDSPVHYRWTARFPAYLPYLGKTLVVDTGDVLVTDLFTHPASRGRGVHRQSVRRSVMTARQSGSRRHLSLVAKWNAPVLSTAHKTGAHLVGSVGFWNFGFFRYFFATGSVALEQNRVRILPTAFSISGAAIQRMNTSSANPPECPAQRKPDSSERRESEMNPGTRTNAGSIAAGSR